MTAAIVTMEAALLTHDFSVVAEFADDVVVMYAGEVMEQGTTRDVFHHPAHPYTEKLLQCDPGNDRQQGGDKTECYTSNHWSSLFGSGAHYSHLSVGGKLIPAVNSAREYPGSTGHGTGTDLSGDFTTDLEGYDRTTTTTTARRRARRRSARGRRGRRRAGTETARARRGPRAPPPPCWCAPFSPP